MRTTGSWRCFLPPAHRSSRRQPGALPKGSSPSCSTGTRRACIGSRARCSASRIRRRTSSRTPSSASSRTSRPAARFRTRAAGSTRSPHMRAATGSGAFGAGCPGSPPSIDAWRRTPPMRPTDSTRCCRAFARSRPRDRLLVALRAQGLSYQEIAQAAGIRPASVGRLLARALDRLEKELARHGDGRSLRPWLAGSDRPA